MDLQGISNTNHSATPTIAPDRLQLQRFVSDIQVFAGTLVSCASAAILVDEFARLLRIAPMSPRAHVVIGERLLTQAFNRLMRAIAHGGPRVQYRALTLPELRQHLARLQTRPAARSTDLIASLLELIRQRHTDPHVTQRQLAAELNRSVSHLSRLLRQATGYGFEWHLAAARLEHAAELLSSSQLTIKEIAAASGFSGTSELDRQFHRAFGITPTAYRIAEHERSREASPLGLSSLVGRLPAQSTLPRRVQSASPSTENDS